MTATVTSTLDVRQIAPRERHSTIFACFDSLQPGQAMRLVNDHDPRPLRYQLESSRFARVQADVARATIQVAYDTRRAWVEAVSAQEAVRYMAQVQASAEASAAVVISR